VNKKILKLFNLSRHFTRQNSYEEDSRRIAAPPPPSGKASRRERYAEREYQISSGGQGSSELYDQYQHTKNSNPQRPKTGYKGRVDTSHYLDDSNYE
jgi:hypothetical protein